jgi:hypothetical protein
MTAIAINLKPVSVYPHHQGEVVVAEAVRKKYMVILPQRHPETKPEFFEAETVEVDAPSHTVRFLNGTELVAAFVDWMGFKVVTE